MTVPDNIPTLRWRTIALIVVASAFVLRSAQFGNPINGLDEQFYLLVGDRMLHGALPYVDLWDRKPFGLFVLFAGVRLLGGNGVVQAQILATLFAAAAAFTVSAIAARSTGRVPALLAGLFYLAMLQALWGGTTQTPVFYNLPIVLAAWLVLRTSPTLNPQGDLTRACGAMLLAGLAIQIKTNAVFEGGLLGVWLIVRMARAGSPMRAIFLRVMLFAGLGLAPTLAAAGLYASLGHLPDWWFANVQSLFLKRGTLGPAAMQRLFETLGLLGPLVVVTVLALTRWTRGFREWPADATLIAPWTAIALIDCFALGGFWPHYALPLVLAASVASTHAFSAPRWGKIAFGVLIFWPTVDGVILDRITAADERRIAAATLSYIPSHAATSCLFIYEGPVAYYQLSHACLVTKFAFPDHLRSSAEAGALGVDSSLALRAALARRPGTILTLDHSLWTERNRANDAIMAATLARDYHPVARLAHRHYSTGREWLVVWRLNRTDHSVLVRQISSLPPYPSQPTMNHAGNQ
ncbi:hypothetical protein BH10PSE14_BH10PSE14_22450 [soil metagenome]